MEGTHYVFDIISHYPRPFLSYFTDLHSFLFSTKKLGSNRACTKLLLGRRSDLYTFTVSD